MREEAKMGLTVVVGLVVGATLAWIDTESRDDLFVRHDKDWSISLGRGTSARIGRTHGVITNSEGGTIPSGWFTGPVTITIGNNPASVASSEDGIGILLLPPHASERFQ